MKRAALGDVVRFRGALCEVIGHSEGRTIVIREIGKDDCPTCGRAPTWEWLESCRIFQDEVEPVQTILDDAPRSGRGTSDG